MISARLTRLHAVALQALILAPVFSPSSIAVAAELEVEITAGRRAIDDAVVYALPRGESPPPPRNSAIMDQKNRSFVPHVLVVQTGTSVSFPNSDNIRHQVYSFSPAKRFQIPLYEGTPAEPITFDKAGVLTLGCNIHDQMSAYIVVVDTPYFASTTEGRAVLDGLPAGTYTVHVWRAGARQSPPPQEVTVEADEHLRLVFDTVRR
jgi:plastocyanin